MFGPLKKLGNNLAKAKLNTIMSEIMSEPSVQGQIVSLNQVQMYDKGIDAHGQSLGEYSKTSVEVYGKRPGHITLHDTGEFYDSMKVFKTGTGAFEIHGDMETHDLQKQWPDALGLTPESISVMLPVVKQKLIDKILKKALG